MADLAPVAPVSTLTVAPIAQASDVLRTPDPPPPPRDDPFGPAVVVVEPAVQRPALVVYDAGGRLTTSVPAHPDGSVLPPGRIDVDDPDAPRSLVYTR